MDIKGIDLYKFSIKEFRSSGFLNRSNDMGRVYIDLPLNKAKDLLKILNSRKEDKPNKVEV